MLVINTFLFVYTNHSTKAFYDSYNRQIRNDIHFHQDIQQSIAVSLQ